MKRSASATPRAFLLSHALSFHLEAHTCMHTHYSSQAFSWDRMGFWSVSFFILHVSLMQLTRFGL